MVITFWRARINLNLVHRILLRLISSTYIFSDPTLNMDGFVPDEVDP
jgi:hypothetical protein